jgi:hypothetical protein
MPLWSCPCDARQKKQRKRLTAGFAAFAHQRLSRISAASDQIQALGRGIRNKKKSFFFDFMGYSRKGQLRFSEIPFRKFATVHFPRKETLKVLAHV